MKVIEVGERTQGNRTRQFSTNDLPTRINRIKTDPKTSSASRVVERKTARPSASGRDRSRRTGDRTTVTTSTERTRTAGTLRNPRTTSVKNTDTTLVTATDLGRRSGSRQRRSAESRIVINGDNNVIVEGDVTSSNPRPHISTRRLCNDISYVHHRPRWKSHSGFYFSFNWSNSSCGRVAYLPYRYRHSWCSYPIGYQPYYGLSYYYPYYHRKYIYVSIGGYWPSYYRYRRYYWYGCHPYYWYGTHVITEPYQDVTYNTYNYYNADNSNEAPLDEPEFESAADLCFARAVELFEAENYADAVLQLREAVSLSPDDIILPFTYSQALFANGDYSHAASVLREAVAQIPEDELTVYYPRGLYKDEAILTEQIKQLEAAAKKEPFDSDYQLLLGYQYLGSGQLDKAQSPLTEAAGSTANTITADKLLELATKLETEAPENE
jgi:tetratricopeptide (TPR) repeat protein